MAVRPKVGFELGGRFGAAQEFADSGAGQRKVVPRLCFTLRPGHLKNGLVTKTEVLTV